MGRQTAPAHALRRRSAGQPTSHPQNAARSTFATPAAEVDVTCRLVLTAYLRESVPDLPAALPDQLLSPASAPKTSPDHSGHWETARRVINRLRVLDPACGDGAFLRGMFTVLARTHAFLDRQTAVSMAPQERLAAIARTNLYGVDVQPALVHQARASLRELAGAAPRLAVADSLVDVPGTAWEDRFPEVMTAGGFDIVVGNPPFVRHERIADPLGLLSPAAYRKEVERGLRRRLVSLPRLEGRADLSLLFTFLCLGLLKQGGVAGLVLPDALFDAAYGRSLLEHLEVSGRVGTVVRSRTYRSFREASVNTSTLVMAPSHQEAAPPLRLLEFDAPLGDVDLRSVFPTDARDRDRRKCQASRLGAADETAVPDGLGRAAAAEGGSQRVPEHSSTRGRRPPLRTRTPVVGGKRDHGSAGQVMRRLVGWPVSDGIRTTEIAELGRLHYALKSGLNRFFYPPPETIARFGIEPGFLRPLLKSPRDVRTLVIRRESLDRQLFSCDLSIEELRLLGKIGAREYITWGARQMTSGRGWDVPRFWPERPSLQGRRHWYSLPIPAYPDIVFPRFFDRRFFVAVAAGPVVADQTFYGMTLSAELRQKCECVAAVLNCSMTYLALESAGRTGLGDGARQYALHDYGGIRILDPRALDAGERARLAGAFQALSQRPILPIEEEIRQPDRQTLDEVAGAVGGMNRDDLDAVRGELARRVEQRLSRARSVLAASGAS